MRLIAILALVCLPAMAHAVPDQMLRQIHNSLRFYQIETDVTKLTNMQATAIYFELTSEPERGAMDRLRKRQRILNIIRKGEDF